VYKDGDERINGEIYSSSEDMTEEKISPSFLSLQSTKAIVKVS
jgi:hypothetical protein